MSTVVKTLKYTSYTGLWLVPVCHAGLYGVVKTFWSLLLEKGKKGEELPWYAIPHPRRAIMRQRAAHVHVTNDFNRPYRDIVQCRGVWTMEDYLHWTEAFSLYILRPEGAQEILHSEVIRTMWRQLRAFIVHHFRALPESLTPAQVLQQRELAAASLMEFSTLAEQHFEGHPLCTYNLHLLNCRLALQQECRGHTSHCGEWWVERLVQHVKSTVRGRHTQTPEIVAVNDLILLQALHLNKSLHQGLKTFDEWVPAWGGGEMQGQNLDPGDGFVGMLGSGKDVKGVKTPEVATNVLLVQKYIREFQPAGWEEEDIGQKQMYIYQHAYKGASADHQSMVLQSQIYKRARTRVSTFALVEYEEGDPPELVTYVAQAQYFLRCLQAEGDPEKDIRLAVCNLYKTQLLEGLYVVANFGCPRQKWTGYPVAIEHLTRKLLYYGVPGSRDALFSVYDTVSGVLE